MKKILCLILTLALTLGLFGCTHKPNDPGEPAEPDPDIVQTDPAGEADPLWHFEAKTELYEEEYSAEDGTKIASVSYETPLLTIVDESGTPVSDSDVPEAMRAVRDAFNAEFADYRAGGNQSGGLRQDAQEWYEASKEYSDGAFIPYSDSLTVERTYETGRLLSVRAFSSLYLGGAHPMDGYLLWNYDLETGEFLTLEDLAQDPAALRGFLAENIIAQINSADDAGEYYFDGYAESISSRESFDGCFDEAGLTVFFSEYELAPYAAGIPEFTIPYADLAPYLNERGAALLSI